MSGSVERQRVGADRWTMRSMELLAAGVVSTAFVVVLLLDPDVVRYEHHVSAATIFLVVGGVSFFLVWWDAFVRS